MTWFILCFLNYLPNDLSHKKVQTCSLCLWSLTSVNLLSALNGYDGSMKIMMQCLCFRVFCGHRPATVCLFCTLVHIGFHTWMDICRFQTMWEAARLSKCQCDGGFEEWEADIEWQTGQWPHPSEINPAEWGLRSGKKLLNYTKCVYLLCGKRFIVRFFALT